MKRRTVNPSRLSQLYALAHAIRNRADKKAVAKVWFERAKALLGSGKK